MLDDEVVLDRVIGALIERPRTFSELFGFCSLMEEPLPDIAQVDEALDVLYAIKALTIFKETRFGERMQIFALRSEARTYMICEYCDGTGHTADTQRGMCQFCHGNGVYSPIPLGATNEY